MSVSARIHGMSKAAFLNKDDTRWITFEDDHGNSLTIFIDHPDQIAAILNACDKALKSLRDSLNPESILEALN